jgi:hypothetical protein
MTCPNCGAGAGRGDSRFCSHCGTATQAAPCIGSDAHRTHPERFDAVEAHPGYQKAIARPPTASLSDHFTAPIVGFVLGAILFYFGGTRLMETRGQVLMVLGFFAVWLAVCVVALVQALRYRAAPVVPCVAVVVDERTEVSGGHGKMPSQTAYYATLQRRCGTRREYEVSGEGAGVLAPGDIGIAFVKAGRLLGFDRVPV